jgi:hypothetical protein
LQVQSLAADGSATPDATAAAVSRAAATNSPAAGVKRIEILFGGSLCPVCLVAFQKRLLATNGVLAAKVEAFRDPKPTGHPPKRAHAVIDFSPEKVSEDALVDLIKTNDFQFLKVVELQPAI